MPQRILFAGVVGITLMSGPAVVGQGSALDSAQARSFMGTWMFTMANPAGAQETVRIWNSGGTVAASVQAGNSPPISVTGILKDGDMLVLSATRFENGKPDRAVISLTPDGDKMKMAQMLEFSETIKRGTAKMPGL